MTSVMDQVEFWNGIAGDRWVLGQDKLDAMLRPFGEAALDAAPIRTGQAVLDVGCGCGDTSLAIAARERGRGASNVRFIEADASRDRGYRGRDWAVCKARGRRELFCGCVGRVGWVGFVPFR
jgi:SAM-dependent methyltransferase